MQKLERVIQLQAWNNQPFVLCGFLICNCKVARTAAAKPHFGACVAVTACVSTGCGGSRIALDFCPEERDPLRPGG